MIDIHNEQRLEAIIRLFEEKVALLEGIVAAYRTGYEQLREELARP